MYALDYTLYHFIHFLGIEPIIVTLLAPCSTLSSCYCLGLIQLSRHQACMQIHKTTDRYCIKMLVLLTFPPVSLMPHQINLNKKIQACPQVDRNMVLMKSIKMKVIRSAGVLACILSASQTIHRTRRKQFITSIQWEFLNGFHFMFLINILTDVRFTFNMCLNDLYETHNSIYDIEMTDLQLQNK